MANLNLSEFTEKLFVADADHTFIWDTVGAISKRVSRNSWLNSGTLTSDAPVTISQTWNGTGSTVFKALVVNATTPGTTSSSSSLLLDLQVGTVSLFKVSKTGSITANNTFNLSGSIVQSSGNIIPSNALIFDYFNQDVVLQRDAANTLALRNGANAQTFNVYGTYTSGTSYERLTLSAPSAANAIIGTNKGSGGGTARGLDLHTDGAARMTISTTGNVGIGTTSPTSKLHVAETWNNAGTAFCAIKSVITDTNSAAGSDFLELYSGTFTQPLRFDVQKTGQMNIYGAWTDTSNYERLSFSAPSAANAIIGTNKAGTGTARGLEFQTDGVTRMTIASGGATTFSSTITSTVITATNFIGVPAGNGLIPALGGGSDFIKIGNNSGSELARVGYFGTAATSYISFGGVANTSPALKRSTTYLQARLADDSAFAPIQGKLTTDTAYTGTVVAATGYITIYDSTGTAYRVPCAV